MNWEQRFEEAFERGYFEYDDYMTAKNVLKSASYDVLCRRGYDRSYYAGDLVEILIKHDLKLWGAYMKFHRLVRFMDYKFIGLAQRKYNRIQNMDLSQSLIDKLELTANPKVPVIHAWAKAPPLFF